MKTVRLIGDVHGSVMAIEKAYRPGVRNIQLGDFGIGFHRYPELTNEWMRGQPDLRFFRGNHDNPSLCKETVGYIEQGSFEDFFIIPGAWSIDQALRVPFIDWWPTEELTNKEFELLLEQYVSVRPRIVLSHTCPRFVAGRLFMGDPNFVGLSGKRLYANRTENWLDEFFRHHKPEQWYFGHWHYSTQATIEGTHFQCLNINEVKDIEV